MKDQRPLLPEELAMVSREINRLELAMTRLQDYARPVVVDKRLFDLREVVAESQQLVAGRASAQDVRMLRDVPESAVLVDADAEQLRQALLNVLLNSLDAMPHGGELRVSIVPAPETPVPESTAIAERSAIPPGQIRLLVTDTGCGFAPEILRRLFQPFVTSRALGTGLGLSICKRIVEAHNGSIQVRNRPSGGALVEICLPACNVGAPMAQCA